MNPGQHGPITQGHPSSPIWIVGEAPGAEEIQRNTPFTGASGQLLDTLLQEVGLPRSQCFITNVCHERPPKNDITAFFPTKGEARRLGLPFLFGRYVHKPIVDGITTLHGTLAQQDSGPRLIVALGGSALWGLTGQIGIMKWRASALKASITSHPNTNVLPTVHPAAILRDYSLKHIVTQDLRRWNRPQAFIKPNWRFIIRPTFDQVIHWLKFLEDNLDHIDGTLPIAADIETRGGQIACIGLAWSDLDAMCIPLMCVEKPEGYWNADEELTITLALRRILRHPRAACIFQNGAYDCQYFARQYGWYPNLQDDTMLMQHVCFAGLKKGLDFLSSLYCTYHRYWKDDGKGWNAGNVGDEDIYWTYNCEDCVRTLEVWRTLHRVIKSMGLSEQYAFQMQMFPIALEMMLRGIKVDFARRAKMALELTEYIDECQRWFQIVLGHPLNVASPKQMQDLFYGDLRVPEIRNRKTRELTLDAEALEKIERRHPVLKPLLQRIADTRTARVTLSNVLSADVSPDGRARSTINIAGTETYRFSSSEDAFGQGFNLQNLTKGEEEE